MIENKNTGHKKSNLSFPYPNKNIWGLLGPSIVFVALSLNGGEMLLWPDLVSRFGLSMLVFVPIILILQFAVNMEIERYSITTGENILTGLLKNRNWLGLLFITSIVVSLMWPAWVSTAGNILAYTFGLGNLGAVFSFVLMIFLLTIWLHPKSYHIIENIAKVGLLFILGISLFVITRLFDFQTIKSSFLSQNYLPTAFDDRFTFLSALAFGGVAGVLNLVQSSWVLSKNYGILSLKQNIPNQDLPLSETIDWQSTQTKQAWNRWWNLLLKEHSVLFLLGNILGIFLIAFVAVLTLFGSNKKGFEILTYQVDHLNQKYFFSSLNLDNWAWVFQKSSWNIDIGAGFLWGIAIFILFIMAQMTILDAAGRLLGQCFKNFKNRYLAKQSTATLSQIFGLIGVVILVIAIVYPGFNQPANLLRISASLSSVVMVIYPPLILGINQKLPKIARPKLWNTALVWLCSCFYGLMVVWVFL